MFWEIFSFIAEENRVGMEERMNKTKQFNN